MRRIEPPAAARSLDPGADVLAAADARSGVLRDEGAGLARLLEPGADEHGVRGRLDRLGQAAPRRKTRRVGQPGSHERELEKGLRAWIQAGRSGELGGGGRRGHRVSPGPGMEARDSDGLSGM
jgi:hypothetical protein